MKILIVSPLYAPDIAPTATYTKELATRLSSKHSVTVATYGHLPEQIHGVKIEVSNKNRPLPVRLINFFLLLKKEIKDADIIYTENGASVELPLGLLSIIYKKPILLHNGDEAALLYSKHKPLFKFTHSLIATRAKAVINYKILAKPETLPFNDTASKDKVTYKESWNKHIAEIEHALK